MTKQFLRRTAVLAAATLTAVGVASAAPAYAGSSSPAGTTDVRLITLNDFRMEVDIKHSISEIEWFLRRDDGSGRQTERCQVPQPIELTLPSPSSATAKKISQ